MEKVFVIQYQIASSENLQRHNIIQTELVVCGCVCVCVCVLCIHNTCSVYTILAIYMHINKYTELYVTTINDKKRTYIWKRAEKYVRGLGGGK